MKQSDYQMQWFILHLCQFHWMCIQYGSIRKDIMHFKIITENNTSLVVAFVVNLNDF